MKVLRTAEFAEWFEGLAAKEQKVVARVVSLLEMAGVTLSRPHSGDIENTKYPIRELRPVAGKSPLRVLYAFDPQRNAVVLIGGDKGKDKRMYERLIPMAEALWRKHIGGF
jgi:hypothetical protein